MKVLISEFRQESNSLTPIRSDLQFWRRNGWLLDPSQVRGHLAAQNTAVAGMISAVETHGSGVQLEFGPAWYSQSGGTAEQSVMDAYWQALAPELDKHLPLDGVFLSCHGALQTTEFDDAEAELARRARGLVGPGCVIAMSTDMHAYISRPLVDEVDILCGYHTYPHRDFAETGARAAALALARISGAARPVLAWCPVPMMVSASAYNTLEGPYRDLHDWADTLVAAGQLLDYSIYQMQPWLDVPKPQSTIITIGQDATETTRLASQIAHRLYAMRHTFQPTLRSIDEVIDLTLLPSTPKPVVLVDSADSNNAGATGDSMAVAARLLDRGEQLRTATVVVDGPAARLAHRLGAGASAEFTLGGSVDAASPQITRECLVRSVHDGVFEQAAPGSGGSTIHLGATAVLQTGSVDVLVCESLAGNGDPALYSSFGMHHHDYDLVVVKANTSFRAAYQPIAGLIIDAVTPGAAGPVIKDLPFARLTKSIYPWIDRPLGELDADIPRSPAGRRRTGRQG